MEVQRFIRFANFYWMFIKNFSDIVRPLYELTKKNMEFEWTEEHEQAF
jgi:hypothetical protein